MEPDFEIIGKNYRDTSEVPHDRDLFYRCTKCGATFPSEPGDNTGCKCGNVIIDRDYWRLAVYDFAHLQVLRDRTKSSGHKDRAAPPLEAIEFSPDTRAYWIQKADFSSVEYGPVSLAGAIAAFDSVNWKQEAAQYDKDSGDSCPAGIAFYGPGYLPMIHICPGADGVGFAHLSFSIVERLFGFIPWKSMQRFYLPAAPNSSAVRLIELFFARDYDAIRAEFNAEPA
jgi:hypothetical protein